MALAQRSHLYVALALQGGGSHGAFTWGVLDRLLEEPRITIDAASGASAGAINAALLAHGLSHPDAADRRAHARHALRTLWQRLADHAPPLAVANGGAPDLGTQMMMMLTRWLAPAQWNPLDFNPLRTLLAQAIDFDRIRAARVLRLFIAATRVDTGTLRIFHAHELTLDALLASACLPWLHHTIEIDGTAYWDGGLAANPPLYSLIDHSDADDLVLVTMHPTRRARMPVQAGEISSRVAEISFTAPFLAELQGVLRAVRAARRQFLPIGRATRRLRRLRVHVIDGGDLTSELAAASRMNVQRAFVEELHARGRERAQQWLDRAFTPDAGIPTASVEALLFPD